MNLRLLALTTLFACTPDKGEPTTDGTSSTATTGSADTSTSTDPTTGEPPTSGGVSTSGDVSITGDSSTTNDPTGEVDDPCAAYCGKLEACGNVEAEGCRERCAIEVASHAYPGEACNALEQAYLACLTAQTCEALDDQNGLCGAENEARMVAACTTELCNSYADRLIECNFYTPELQVARALECTSIVTETRFATSEACGDATEARITCTIGLPCEELQGTEGCAAEAMAANMVCG